MRWLRGVVILTAEASVAPSLGMIGGIVAVSVSLEVASAHTGLRDMAADALLELETRISAAAACAGIDTLDVLVRLTDAFVDDVEASDRRGRPEYTTERIGGTVAAISMKHDTSDGQHLVLVNSAAFTVDGSWAAAYLPRTLAHELSHCLIAECRRVLGSPQGYEAHPESWIENVGCTAVSVCDEFLADEFAKALALPVAVTINDDCGSRTTDDRLLGACDHLARMHDDLDRHVYPFLGDRVQQYRLTAADLDGMVASVASGVRGCLIHSAHFRSSTLELKLDIEEMRRIKAHMGYQLYLEPFWNRVGPLLDERVDRNPFSDFAVADQRAFDVASDAVEQLWRTLGVTFEPMPEGGEFVHVDAPVGW